MHGSFYVALEMKRKNLRIGFETEIKKKCNVNFTLHFSTFSYAFGEMYKLRSYPYVLQRNLADERRQGKLPERWGRLQYDHSCGIPKWSGRCLC